MESFHLQVIHALVTIFFVLFLDKVAYRVEGDTILQVANVGDNITLDCNRPGYVDNFKRWYRDRLLLADRNGISVTDPRMTQKYNQYGNLDSTILYISDIRIDDSDTYRCINFHGNEVRSYDLCVIGCTCSSTTLNRDSEKVICNLENYRTVTTSILPLNITINRGNVKTAQIQGNAFSFAILRHELYNDLEIEFNPYSNTYSSITCILPAQPTPPYITTRYPTTPFYTSLIPITQNEEFVSLRTASQELTSGTQYPTKHLITQNKNSGPENSTGNGNITMIIAILGSVFILILILIIIVLRCKQTKDRQKNKFNGNVSIKKEHPAACYESVQDGSRNNPEYATSTEKVRKTNRDQENVDDLGNGGMVENILYDSSDRITENSISRVEGPLNDALYAMPDKRATIIRASTSKVVDGSSNSDVLYGNSDIISQHEQSKDTLQRGDQYENVEIPGSGNDAEEIALYAMPDKGPKRNTLKTIRKPEKTSSLSKDEVVDVDALYAEVDKPKKK